MFLLAGIILMAAPPEDVLADRCDVIELNHFYDGDGRLVFDQWIFWDWGGRRFRVRDWRMVRSDARPEWTGSTWRLRWHDQGRLREVEAQEFRQTWKQWDPELHDRKIWPTCLRAGLRQ